MRVLLALLGIGILLAYTWPQSERDKVAARIAHSACTSRPAACAPEPVAAQVPAGDYTPASWALALLALLGAPGTAANLTAVTAWERAEGGHWANTARFNPLNTTQPEPGSWPVNADGVQAFLSWDQGLTATVTTLGYAPYQGVRAALGAGNCAACVAAAVGASPWGTGRFAT